MLFKNKIFFTFIISLIITMLSACSSFNPGYSSLSGSFEAQIDKNLTDVYTATKEVIEYKGYTITSDKKEDTNAEISGETEKNKTSFNIKLTSATIDSSYIKIKYGSLGDRNRSVAFLDQLRDTLGADE
ncbi:DUF3568 family protein [Francisella frigiditurris]|uniref:Lipoprotein n=1 Tax=Francisella frigiditurris TaxID=1542390 RepID=A0A1J0KRL5_9GAMM|nr:DUF3568 family protein [Francisella frigiditurris]APC96252.1 hypothetical protein KX01_501 [Francisella frigiditurris]